MQDNSSKKLVLYICMSLDGFIAGNRDDLSWLSIVEKEGEDYGYAEFIKDIDTYIVGRKTYDIVKKMVGAFPHKGLFDCYVLTKQRLEEEGVTFYNGDINALIASLRGNNEGKNIWCDGGSEVVRLCMDNNLIDEYIISIVPIVLGQGKRLFKEGVATTKLKHVSTKSFETGLVQIKYTRC